MLKLPDSSTHLTCWHREGTGTHSSTLAWKIPWTEEPGRLQSMGSRRVGHDWSNLEEAAAGHAGKVMYKILQARLQQYVNHELPDVHAGFRKGKGTRDQIANILWLIEKAREFQKNIYLYFDYAKAFDFVDCNKLWKILRDGNARPPDLSPEKPACRSRSNS